MWVLIFSTTSETFLWQEEFSEILSQMYVGLHAKFQAFLSNFNWTYFSRWSLVKAPNIKFKKIRPAGAELIHADGHEANSHFSQLYDRP